VSDYCSCSEEIDGAGHDQSCTVCPVCHKEVKPFTAAERVDMTRSLKELVADVEEERRIAGLEDYDEAADLGPPNSEYP
jgi:hypothetical protein